MVEENKDVNTIEEQSTQHAQTQPNMAQAQQVPNNTVQLRYSGFWVRGAAHIIDGLVLTIISMIIIMPLGFLIGFTSAMSESKFMEFMGQVIMTIIGFAISWAYYIFMTHKFQATLGKMAVGAKVLDANGQRLSLGKIVLRETIGKFVSGMIMGIGYLMVAFTSKKQGLHDMMAGSVVVYKDAQKGANAVVVGIVYVLYGIIMMVFMAIVFFVVFIIGATALEGEHSGLNSFFNYVNSEINDDTYTDDDSFFDDDYYMDDDLSSDTGALNSTEDEAKGDY